MDESVSTAVVEYLLEENRVLREQIGSRRMRFNDDQRRRLAVRAKTLRRKLLARVEHYGLESQSRLQAESI
jgi:hypothetical protein